MSAASAAPEKIHGIQAAIESASAKLREPNVFRMMDALLAAESTIAGVGNGTPYRDSEHTTPMERLAQATHAAARILSTPALQAEIYARGTVHPRAIHEETQFTTLGFTSHPRDTHEVILFNQAIPDGESPIVALDAFISRTAQLAKIVRPNVPLETSGKIHATTNPDPRSAYEYRISDTESMFVTITNLDGKRPPGIHTKNSFLRIAYRVHRSDKGDRALENTVETFNREDWVADTIGSLTLPENVRNWYQILHPEMRERKTKAESFTTKWNVTSGEFLKLLTADPTVNELYDVKVISPEQHEGGGDKVYPHVTLVRKGDTETYIEIMTENPDSKEILYAINQSQKEHAATIEQARIALQETLNPIILTALGEATPGPEIDSDSFRLFIDTQAHTVRPDEEIDREIFEEYFAFPSWLVAEQTTQLLLPPAEIFEHAAQFNQGGELTTKHWSTTRAGMGGAIVWELHCVADMESHLPTAFATVWMATKPLPEE